MALLTRALQKIFGSTGGTTEFGQVGSKAAGSPVTTKNLETIQSLSQYDQGLNAIVSDQGTSVLPYLEDINSLHFLETSQLAYLMQSGIPEWDDATEYYQNVSLVLHDGNIWVDIFGTVGTPNLNYEPTTNLDKWRAITVVATLEDSGAADAYVLTTQEGAVPAAYLDGMKIYFKAANSNTGASTVNVDSLGLKDIEYPDGTALNALSIIAGSYVTAVYNSTDDRFELVEVDLAKPGDLRIVATDVVPFGYAECNGQNLSRTTYADLFARIGVKWGNGDGSTTFTTPDFRGKFLRGWDHGAGNDPDAATRTAQATGGNTGDNVGSIQGFETEVMAAEVGISGNEIRFDLRTFSFGYDNVITGVTNTPSTGTENTGTQVTPAGSGETRPINANVLILIKL